MTALKWPILNTNDFETLVSNIDDINDSLFIFKIEFENGNAIEAEDEADSGDSSGLDLSVDVLYNKFFGSAREYSP